MHSCKPTQIHVTSSVLNALRSRHPPLPYLLVLPGPSFSSLRASLHVVHRCAQDRPRPPQRPPPRLCHHAHACPSAYHTDRRLRGHSLVSEVPQTVRVPQGREMG